MDEFQRNILSHIQSSSSLNPQICPACGKHFATESGANKHLAQSRKCVWYNKNKFEDLPVYPDTEDYNEDLPNNKDETLPPDLDKMQVDSNIGADYEETITITPNKKQPTPESSRSTELCDLYYEDYPGAGQILGGKATTQEQWNQATTSKMDENLFYPFESELDWNMAEWLVNDGPSQSANNRLLKILHVSKVLFLFSSLLIFLNLL